MSTSVRLQEVQLSPQAKTHSRRHPRVAALANWLFRYNADLIKAVESEDETKVRNALEKGADVNSKNAESRTPLFGAVSTGNEVVLQLLLKSGPDVNAEDAHRITALMYSKTEAMISVLLERGAKIETNNRDGSTALHQEAKSGHKTLVQLLLNHGADIDKKTNGATRSGQIRT